MEKKTENNRSADKFLVVMKHMTHGKVMFSTDWAVSIHVTEQLLRTSHSVGRSSSVVLSHLVSPEEPLVGLTLEGLRHQCSEPRTVFARRPQQLEKSKNNSTTSAGIVHIYCRYCKSSGHNYMFISHFKTVCVCVCGVGGSSARQVHRWGEHRQPPQRETWINLCKFLFSRAAWRKYLCGSAAHLVLGPGDGVHGNRPPR